MSETLAPAAPEDSTVEGLVDDDTDLVAEDLIEEISIDGMCGVY
jgi:mycofactocin precursor